jgi:hypothetical protein
VHTPAAGAALEKIATRAANPKVAEAAAAALSRQRQGLFQSPQRELRFWRHLLTW